MKSRLKDYRQHWRDVLVVLTAALVLGSLVLVAYGNSRTNAIIVQVRELSVQSNKLAQDSTDHINCIIKDLSVPRPPGTNQKVIELLGKDCNIKFTQ